MSELNANAALTEAEKPDDRKRKGIIFAMLLVVLGIIGL